MRKAILAFLLLVTSVAIVAQTAPRDEVPFTILSATVQKFERPMPSRRGPYREALVLKLDTSALDYEALSPSSEAFLYIGTHELRPIRFEPAGSRLIVTFHDPDWQKLSGGEPMVLTTRHGDPINNPEKYKGYPPFDPRVIGK